ncbi:MAG: hypothetical protein QG582_407 [Candidatus Thermoplasmatota archaeon]|nr:hypothetical protein [Candidatus Thermoplasmatota archaeon]
MVALSESMVLLGVLGALLLFIYLYVASIRKVLVTVGFAESETSAILLATFLLGWVTIPVFPFNGWWVGLSVGGAIIPLILCVMFLKDGRAGVAEALIGVTIVAYITYVVTRAEEGVGIVAEVPMAFAPALAAGLYSVSVFWVDIRKAAPLAYVSGVLGTLAGADVFRLGEMLAFEAPEDSSAVLSIGGANIFDMVYLTGVIAVGVAMIVLWVKAKRDKIGFGLVQSEFESGAQGLPYAKDIEPTRNLSVRKGRLE